jgi:hypothetical protein
MSRGGKMLRLSVLLLGLAAAPAAAQNQTFLWSEDAVLALPRPPVDRAPLDAAAAAPAPATAAGAPEGDLRRQFDRFMAWRAFETFMDERARSPRRAAPAPSDDGDAPPQ